MSIEMMHSLSLGGNSPFKNWDLVSRGRIQETIRKNNMLSDRVFNSINKTDAEEQK